MSNEAHRVKSSVDTPDFVADGYRPVFGDINPGGVVQKTELPMQPERGGVDTVSRTGIIAKLTKRATSLGLTLLAMVGLVTANNYLNDTNEQRDRELASAVLEMDMTAACAVADAFNVPGVQISPRTTGYFGRLEGLDIAWPSGAKGQITESWYGGSDPAYLTFVIRKSKEPVAYSYNNGFLVEIVFDSEAFKTMSGNKRLENLTAKEFAAIFSSEQCMNNSVASMLGGEGLGNIDDHPDIRYQVGTYQNREDKTVMASVRRPTYKNPNLKTNDPNTIIKAAALLEKLIDKQIK